MIKKRPPRRGRLTEATRTESRSVTSGGVSQQRLFQAVEESDSGRMTTSSGSDGGTRRPRWPDRGAATALGRVHAVALALGSGWRRLPDGSSGGVACFDGGLATDLRQVRTTLQPSLSASRSWRGTRT